MFMAGGLQRYSAGRKRGTDIQLEPMTSLPRPGGGQLSTRLSGRALRVAALLALSLCIAACSALKLGYENLPRLATWQVDRYLALDDEQKALVARRAGELQRWHRQNLLPVYAGFLGRIEEEVRSPVTATQVAAWRRELQDGWTPLARQLAPAVAELALTLRPEQLDHLRGAIARANEKAAEKYHPADPALRPTVRYRRLVERTESFLGEASDAQKAAIHHNLPASLEQAERWWGARLARQQAVVGLLEALAQEKPAPAEAEHRVRTVLVGLFDETPDRADDGANDRGAAQGPTPNAGDVLTARLLSLATPQQRSHLVSSLRDYRNDFLVLAAR